MARLHACFQSIVVLTIALTSLSGCGEGKDAVALNEKPEPPHIVLLTPGPYNETYFEHAYLARYLGFPLVEGGDLTIRDRRVFIKTLEGLRPVDVILRRVDGWYCDPLELRGDSFLGVPGLVEATRAGNVTVANALGAGLLESPAFLAFLPGLCRQVLGEELLMPSVAPANQAIIPTVVYVRRASRTPNSWLKTIPPNKPKRSPQIGCNSSRPQAIRPPLTLPAPTNCCAATKPK